MKQLDCPCGGKIAAYSSEQGNLRQFGYECSLCDLRIGIYNTPEEALSGLESFFECVG